jgi:hypothetical protein
MMPTMDNCIKKSSGHQKLDRVIRISEEMNRKEFHKQCKVNKCTPNEALRAIMGVAIREYAIQNNDPDFKEMGIIQTNSMIGLPGSPKDMTFGNSWIPQMFNILIDDDMKKAI